jgi:opacity protein-like surface antigen
VVTSPEVPSDLDIWWRPVARKVHHCLTIALKCQPKGTRQLGCRVKQTSVASVVILALASSVPVYAADMAPIPMAPVPIALPFDWEGFYVGVHTGAATDDVSFTQTNLTWSCTATVVVGSCAGIGTTSVNTGESGTLRASNAIGGLQAGYNWVLPGPYLFGLEADISGTDISSTVLTNPPGDPSAVAQWNDKVNVFGTARARLGYIAGPWLFYATGGFGWAYDKFTRTQLTAPLFAGAPFVDVNALHGGAAVTASHLRAGWTAGAGVEWAFARTWTVKLEYLHLDMQSELLSSGQFNYVIAGSPSFSSSVTAQTSNLTIDTVRVGLNHTFN